ncbi:YesL family protein [Amphibacillus cookii]|uniref:YesL family protein n=1 Tax=Amphibacillus cookii TaxID=767787 RepID=UPI00195B7DB0|nr:DUF624 domain-containing protein [Amphibacillus cookii]MBM7539893.1 putative membrane protein YesL [Amphibacillus cookii]
MYQNSWFMRIGTLGFHLLLLNMFFWVGLLIGIGIFGLFPSIVALFAALKQLVINKDDQKLSRTFWQNYKNEFLAANLLGFIYSVSFSSLYFYYRILHTLSSPIWVQLGSGVFIFVLLIIVLSLSAVFPLFVHYKYRTWQYPKFALIYAVSRPLHTLSLLLILLILCIIYLRFFALFLLIGVSLMALVIIWIGSSHLLSAQSL